MDYCPECGGTHIKLDGTACECTLNVESIFSDVVCLDIPEQYQGVVFSDTIVPKDLGEYYPKYLQELYDKITSLQLQNKNIIICSPASHSKTIMAYSAIQSLFRMNVPIAPLYDILEIRRISADIDLGKESNTIIFDAPYLFAKVPIDTNFSVYASIASLLDRRVRRGNSTILLYNGS